MPVYKLMEAIYLNKYDKCYTNIITISKNPNDPNLNNIIKTLPKQKLSIFDYNSSCCETPHCILTFIHPQTKKLLKTDEIDVLFTELINAGYTIEYEMTKLIKNKKIICFISK